MIFVHDTRDKPGKHKNVEAFLTEHGHNIVRSKLYVGDITLLHDPTVCIDLKQNVMELIMAVYQQHKRFRAELIRAQEVGISVVVLVEHGGGIKSLDDVPNWVNPRLKVSPLAVSGERLYKILKAMEYTYKVRFEFCTKAQTGKRILQILTEGKDGNTETET